MAESRAALNRFGEPCFTEKSIEFQEKIMKTSGISEMSIFPESILPKSGQNPLGKDAEVLGLSMKGAREEAEAMMCKTVADLLAATGTAAVDIGIVIVNCSLFCPTPSLSAMLVNHFKMRSDCLTYNLGGMGCSAGGISIDLARRLLRGHEQKGSLALVVSTENITQNWYRGNDRGMLLQNTLFRCGAAAIRRRRHEVLLAAGAAHPAPLQLRPARGGEHVAAHRGGERHAAHAVCREQALAAGRGDRRPAVARAAGAPGARAPPKHHEGHLRERQPRRHGRAPARRRRRVPLARVTAADLLPPARSDGRGGDRLVPLHPTRCEVVRGGIRRSESRIGSLAELALSLTSQRSSSQCTQRWSPESERAELNK